MTSETRAKGDKPYVAPRSEADMVHILADALDRERKAREGLADEIRELRERLERVERARQIH